MNVSDIFSLSPASIEAYSSLIPVLFSICCKIASGVAPPASIACPAPIALFTKTNPTALVIAKKINIPAASNIILMQAENFPRVILKGHNPVTIGRATNAKPSLNDMSTK